MFVHELGHYAFARRFGVAVHTFAIGLPPRVWSRLRGDDAIPAEPLAQDAATPVDGAVRLVGAADPDDPGLRSRILLYHDVEPPTRAELRAAQAEGAVGAILAVPPELTTHLAGADALALPVVRVDPETGTAIAARLRQGELQAELRRGRGRLSRRSGHPFTLAAPGSPSTPCRWAATCGWPASRETSRRRRDSPDARPGSAP